MQKMFGDTTSAIRHQIHVGFGSRVDGAMARTFLTLLQHWSGAVTCPVDAARLAAGPNALRGSGPNR